MTIDGLMVYGDNFNPDAVCPHYLPEYQYTFTWYRNDDGIPVLSGYDPEDDLATDWLCVCGHFETAGGHCSHCGAEPPWGCDCGMHDEYDEYWD